jgi:predicted DNA-binding transcriptional regulator AlpA
MESRILLINEVAATLRVSISTINRWLGQTRRGIGQFPKPISVAGGKGRWLASDIERWLESQSIAISPVNVPTARQAKRNARAFQERQASADRALARFRTRGEK